MERFKVGIIGAGHIARKMAHTLRDMEGVEPYAVASRNQENAEGFASDRKTCFSFDRRINVSACSALAVNAFSHKTGLPFSRHIRACSK